MPFLLTSTGERARKVVKGPSGHSAGHLPAGGPGRAGGGKHGGEGGTVAARGSGLRSCNSLAGRWRQRESVSAAGDRLVQAGSAASFSTIRSWKDFRCRAFSTAAI